MSNIKWALDPAHSEVTFKIKHLMISTVTGRIKNFNLSAETLTDDFNTAKNIEFIGDIDSIDTNNEQRDGHLKSADFFNKEQFPHVKFIGKKYEVVGEEGTLQGDLTMAGITKPIILNIEFGGIVIDPYGQTKAGFTVTGKISRKDFGITWGSVSETGSVLLGDEIKINAEIQLIKHIAQPAEKEQVEDLATN